MPGEIVIKVDLAKYKYVDLNADNALKLLEKISEILGKKTNDLNEAIRYIKNFEEFYEFMRKKFKDFISPPRKPDDFIKGNVIVDKIKLYKEGDEKRVVIVFDRRISVDVLSQALKEIGFDNVKVEKMI